MGLHCADNQWVPSPLALQVFKILQQHKSKVFEIPYSRQWFVDVDRVSMNPRHSSLLVNYHNLNVLCKPSKIGKWLW